MREKFLLMWNSILNILFPDSRDKNLPSKNLKPTPIQEDLYREAKLSVTYFFSYKNKLTKKYLEEIKRYRKIIIFDYFGAIIAKDIESNYPWAHKELILIPIPQTKRRLKERGYDVTLELCNSIAKNLPENLSVKTLSNLLINNKTTHQSGLNRRDRIEKSKNMFLFTEAPLLPKNKTVILIDDVYTTGASLREATRLLHNNSITVNKTYTIAH